MKILVLAALGAGLIAAPSIAQEKRVAPTKPGEMMLFEMKNFNGDDYVIDGNRAMVKTDWNIRSIGIHPGERWQICAKQRFKEPCIVLDRSVDDASLVGIEGQIGSARPAPEGK